LVNNKITTRGQLSPLTNLNINKMKTIYLRQKRSGNYELSNRKNHTSKFTTWKALSAWYNDLYYGRIIKAEYRLTQTYFNSFDELKTFIKKANG